jgi:hypothetical protein
LYHPTQTQVRREIKVVVSDEADYRSKNYPTIEQRVESQLIWASKQITGIKKQIKKESQKKIDAEQRLLKQTAILSDIENLANNKEEINRLLKLGRSQDSMEHENIVDADDANNSADFVEIKEKKLLSIRNNSICYEKVSNYKKRKMALAIYFQLNHIDYKNKNFTYILPWLLIGTKDLALNLQFLLASNVTHILNLSTNIPNFYPNIFIYKRVAIDDDSNSNFQLHFVDVIEFMNRVKKKRGKVSFILLNNL